MAAQAEQESVGCGTDGLLQQELLAVSPKVFSLVAMTGHGRLYAHGIVAKSGRTTLMRPTCVAAAL